MANLRSVILCVFGEFAKYKKNFPIFYQVNHLFLHQAYLKSSLLVKLTTKHAKNHFLLLKNCLYIDTVYWQDWVIWQREYIDSWLTFRNPVWSSFFCKINLKNEANWNYYWKRRLRLWQFGSFCRFLKAKIWFGRFFFHLIKWMMHNDAQCVIVCHLWHTVHHQ